MIHSSRCSEEKSARIQGGLGQRGRFKWQREKERGEGKKGKKEERRASRENEALFQLNFHLVSKRFRKARQSEGGKNRDRSSLDSG